MIKELFILSLLFLIAGVNAQTQIDPNQVCSDKCENSILYQNGYLNGKVCEYKTQTICDYGCSSVSSVPECNKLPADEFQAREKIYEKVENLNARIGIYGTEYQVGDSATVFLQLTYNYLPINNGSCLFDAYYPDKSVFMNDISMTYLNGSDGLYYHDFTVPNITGVYMLSATCKYPFDVKDKVADGLILTYGIQSGGTYEDTWHLDGATNDFKETRDGAGQPWHFNFSYLFICPQYGIDYTASDIYKTEFTIYYDWFRDGFPSTPEVEDVYMKLWNYNTSSWHILPNNLEPVRKFTNYMVMNVIMWYGDTLKFTNFINATSNEMRVGFSDANQSSTIWQGQMRIDYLHMSMYVMKQTPLDILRGSGELHVSPKFSENVYDTFWLLGNPNEQLISNHDYCYDNTTLIKEITTQKCIDSICKTFTENRNITCDYGCQNNECLSHPFWSWIIVLIIIIIIGILAWIFYPKD